MTWAQKLKDPRWQEKRREVLKHKDSRCEACYVQVKTLHVHHPVYEKGKNPWDYPADELHVYCADCHKLIHEFMETFRGLFYTHKDTMGCLISVLKNKRVPAVLVVASQMVECLRMAINSVMNKDED